MTLMNPPSPSRQVAAASTDNYLVKLDGAAGGVEVDAEGGCARAQRSALAPLALSGPHALHTLVLRAASPGTAAVASDESKQCVRLPFATRISVERGRAQSIGFL